MKHFNLGNVWGRVAKCELEYSTGGTPYLAIQLECGNELYGNVRTYGRLWGQERIDAFMAHHKQNPGSAYRFKGFFSQYDKDEDRRYSNYTFFSWEPVAGREYRAAFVLVGEVLSIVDPLSDDGDRKVLLSLVREGQNGHKDVEEDFVVYAFEPRQLDGIGEGDTIKVKGYLRAREPEDEFGEPTGLIRPYAMEIWKLNSEPAEAGALEAS